MLLRTELNTNVCPDDGAVVVTVFALKTIVGILLPVKDKKNNINDHPKRDFLISLTTKNVTLISLRNNKGEDQDGICSI